MGEAWEEVTLEIECIKGGRLGMGKVRNFG